ncbi:MAG: GGDEF domain-containing protein [Microcoleaceae cyanobacterium]
MTFSIGMASIEGYNYPVDILRDADIALCRAKTLGKDQYQIFDA